MRPELIQELVKKLAKYYNYEVSEVDYEFWFDVFNDCSEEEFKNAGREFIKTGAKFMPKAGELYQIVAKKRNARRLEHLPEASDVMSEIMGSLHPYERCPSKYSHPIVDELVRRHGYTRMCEQPSATTRKELTWAIKEALDNYRDSDRDDYTEEAEKRLLERQAKEAKRLGDGGVDRKLEAHNE